MGVLAAGVLAARALSEAAPGAEDGSRRALPVATAAPEPAAGYARRRTLTGEIRPRRRVALAFEVGGRVAAVLADEGQAVEAGSPLARLDASRLDAERAVLVAGRREAEALLAEMRAGPRRETLDAAAELVAELEAQRALLEKQRARRADLLRQRTISEEEYDEVETRWLALRARLRAAEDRLAELRAGTRAETLRAQEARVAALVARIARLDLDRGDTTLAAPFAGRVLVRHVDEGAVVAAGMPAFDLVEDGALEAWIGVPPAAAAGLEDGEAYPVAVGGTTYAAVLQARLPATDLATRTQTVVFRLPPEAVGRALPGRVATLALEERVEGAGFWVQASALVRGVRGLWAVYAVEADPDGVARVVRHPVEVLHAQRDRVFVRGTLAADARLVVGNTERIAPGQRVTPAADVATVR